VGGTDKRNVRSCAKENAPKHHPVGLMEGEALPEKEVSNSVGRLGERRLSRSPNWCVSDEGLA